MKPRATTGAPNGEPGDRGPRARAQRDPRADDGREEVQQRGGDDERDEPDEVQPRVGRLDPRPVLDDGRPPRDEERRQARPDRHLDEGGDVPLGHQSPTRPQRPTERPDRRRPRQRDPRHEPDATRHGKADLRSRRRRTTRPPHRGRPHRPRPPEASRRSGPQPRRPPRRTASRPRSPSSRHRQGRGAVAARPRGGRPPAGRSRRPPQRGTRPRSRWRRAPPTGRTSDRSGQHGDAGRWDRSRSVQHIHRIVDQRFAAGAIRNVGVPNC